MYSFPNFEPVHCSMPSSKYCLTCPAFRFLMRQVRWSGISISSRIFHSLLWYTQSKDLALPTKQKIFSWNSLAFFYDPTDVGNLTSGSSAFSKLSFCIRKFSVCVLLKSSLKDFEHNLASIWNDCNWMVVWTFFAIAVLWDWNENWPFPVLWPLLSFPNLLAYWVQHFNSIIF